MYKYGLKISDEKFRILNENFEVWLEDYRTCETDELYDDGEYQTYDSVEYAYELGYEDVNELYEDVAKAAYYKGITMALRMFPRIMNTE